MSKFLAEIRKIDNGHNTSLLESVSKGYALIESWIPSGLADIGKKIAGKAKEVGKGLMKEPTASYSNEHQSPMTDEERKLVATEGETLEKDYAKFTDACSTIVDLISTYGPREFNIQESSPNFRSACAKGRRLDNIRPNPMAESVVRSHHFNAFVESLYDGTNGDDISRIKKIYMETDGVGTVPLMEGPGAGYDIKLGTVFEPTVEVGKLRRPGQWVRITATFSTTAVAEGYDWNTLSADDTEYPMVMSVDIDLEKLDWDITELPTTATFDDKIEYLKGIGSIAFDTIHYGGGYSFSSFSLSHCPVSVGLGTGYYDGELVVEFIPTPSSYNRDYINGDGSLVCPEFSAAIDEAHDAGWDVLAESVYGNDELGKTVEESVKVSMREAMNAIANFIAHHGIYLWKQFRGSPKFMSAYRKGMAAERG